MWAHGIMHDGHVDYLHDGHLHHLHDGHIDEHVIDITGANPKNCTPEHQCAGHPQEHTHGPCGHEAVPHGEHIDYLVDGHLHHPHDGHCDDHRRVTVGLSPRILQRSITGFVAGICLNVDLRLNIACR